MSYRKSTSHQSQQSTKSCTVCKNAGKPKQLYLSHWTKDSKGTVICPTVLAFTCSNCGVKGHSAKLCRLSNYSLKPTTNTKHITKPNTRTITNIFDAFNDPDFQEPTLSTHNTCKPNTHTPPSPPSPPSPPRKSWAQIIANNNNASLTSSLQQSNNYTTISITSSHQASFKSRIGSNWNWADDDDSDNDNDNDNLHF